MRAPHRLALGFFLLSTVALACGAPTSANLPAAQIIPAPDLPPGKLLFVKDGNVWSWSEGRARQLTDGGTWQQPRWSPDGAEIAFVYRSTNFSEIFVMDADGGSPRRLTRSQSSSLSDNDWVFRPTWSPNGAQIAFISDSASFHPTVWLMNRDGSGRRQVLPIQAHQEAADTLSWSPDGKRLAVTAFGEGLSQILLLDLARGVGQSLTDHPRGALDPAWSPDGSTIAYVVREPGRTDIRLRPLDGSSEIEVTRNGFARSPTWSPDGDRLAYVSSRTGTFEVHVVDLALEQGRTAVKNERQVTRDLNLDATSGLSWAR